MPGSKYSKDLEGRKFNRTTIVSFSHTISTKHETRYYWKCLCDCGKEHIADVRSMFRGDVESCGCLRKEKLEIRMKHGHTDAKGRTSREFNSWKKMRQRCDNPRCEYAHCYIQRGIKYCSGFNEFSHFFAVMGSRPPGTTLDRKNNDGHYSCGSCSECKSNNWPLNCRWATPAQQSDNTRRSIRLTLNGRTQTILEWSRELGISRSSIRKRLHLGWTHERTLMSPLRR
jgi:hypothetical protein